ncbi:anti-sigma factor [Brevibacillus antibioticus]|uniref:Anti-sigma factor n=1 Tax=Brevibacillus antibioticus TaxID=2570228 RepID=A0A4U2YDV2_9BACL|nr:anti-sigma factor [Brevibacillus antibioticus]TKI58989.1 anti-sigma factor [Brevibacillus antibioticus]
MMNKDENHREQRLLAYLRGEMAEEDSKQFEEEIAADEEYAQRLERLLLGEETGEDNAKIKQPETLSAEKQRAIVRRGKWKNRLSNAGFTIVLPFLTGVVLLILNGWVGSLMHEDLFRVAKSMVNFTQPGVSVGGSGSQVGLLYGNISMELRERVGSEEKNAGRFESTNVLWNVNAGPKWTNGVREQKLYFRYPTEGEKEGTMFLTSPAWTTMEKLPEGTVSQLAISFDHFLTYEEYYELVSRHVTSSGQDTVWFAVDTGVERKQAEGEGGKRFLGPGYVWGFAQHELDYGSAPIQVNGEEDRRMAAYLEEMKYLSEQEDLASDIGRSLLFRRDLQIAERYSYMQEKGVRIYGAVLTGPTKELLKLKAEKSITAALLGKVDWWNWERPAASGTHYTY